MVAFAAGAGATDGDAVADAVAGGGVAGAAFGATTRAGAATGGAGGRAVSFGGVCVFTAGVTAGVCVVSRRVTACESSGAPMVTGFATSPPRASCGRRTGGGGASFDRP